MPFHRRRAGVGSEIMRTTLPVLAARGSRIERKRRHARHFRLISCLFILLIAISATVTISLLRRHYEIGSLQINDLQHYPDEDPLRFIAVVGLYHSGTSAMYHSLRKNEAVASEISGIQLHTYVSGEGGYPPCGLPLLSDSTVDMNVTLDESAGTDESNAKLFSKYGTMWADWHGTGPKSTQALLAMDPPNKKDEWFTIWKHTPPQHPVLTCFREDTLYVIMVRHPKVWKRSMEKKLYDFTYDKGVQLWRLVRQNPRRMPPLEIRFRSLYDAWSYYMRGYLSWELISAAKNCYAPGSDDAINCLVGTNNIPKTKRNLVIVRYEEDYLSNPSKVLALIYSFASRGLVDAKTDGDRFVPHEVEKLAGMKATLQSLKDHNFFSVERSEIASQLEMCDFLGYSCDESANLFRDSS